MQISNSNISFTGLKPKDDDTVKNLKNIATFASDELAQGKELVSDALRYNDMDITLDVFLPDDGGRTLVGEIPDSDGLVEKIYGYLEAWSGIDEERQAVSGFFRDLAKGIKNSEDRVIKRANNVSQKAIAEAEKKRTDKVVDDLFR